MSFNTENEQNDYILDKLSKLNTCLISDKHIDQLDRIVKDRVKDIIMNNSDNGSDMKAILCLFDTMLLSSTNNNKTKSRGLYNLTSSINDWIVKMKKLDVRSVEGYVYKTKVLDDVDVIIKVPQDSYGFESMIKEYYVGLILNKLRYITPVFVYTLGSFLCSDPTLRKKICERKISDDEKSAFVIYENVDGMSMADLLKNNKIDIDDFTSIFIQLLYGLEIAQRDCKFTHFDLHTGNVMVKKGNFKSYSFILGDEIVTVENPKYIPVVIDFGMATATDDGVTVGDFSFPMYGMMEYMVPGYDAFKFLVSSIRDTRGNPIRNDMLKFFSLFKGDRDPYDVWGKNGYVGIVNASEEYCKMASFSGISPIRPGVLVDEIMSTPNLVSQKVRNMFVSGVRNKFAIVKYDSMIKQYEYIFDHKMTGIEKAVEQANDCITKNPSYINGLYNAIVLQRYNKSLEVHTSLASTIRDIKSSLQRDKDMLIEIDNIRLSKVFSIEIPDEKTVEDVCERITKVMINSNSQTIDEALKLLPRLKYHSRVKPYLDMFYTIVELKITSDFDEWITNFVESSVYSRYIMYEDKVETALRWAETLQAAK